MAKKADQPQVNLRVDQTTMDILDAVIFVDRLRGVQELLLPAIEELAAKAKKRPEISAAVQARREADAQTSGTLKRLPGNQTAT
jgi:hypothetical protein